MRFERPHLEFRPHLIFFSNSNFEFMNSLKQTHVLAFFIPLVPKSIFWIICRYLIRHIHSIDGIKINPLRSAEPEEGISIKVISQFLKLNVSRIGKEWLEWLKINKIFCRDLVWCFLNKITRGWLGLDKCWYSRLDLPALCW